MSSEKALSERDLSILNLIFDPSEVNKKVEDITKPVIDEIEVKDQEEENSKEIIDSKKLEIEGVKLSESGELNDALEKFNEALKIAPNRPSIYNNRAQLYRFMEKDSLALEDLEKAIDLSRDTYPLTKCRALCQRGLIKRKVNDTESARDDFNEAAKLGSKFARQQLVDINPYAQLCNQMVKQLLNDLK